MDNMDTFGNNFSGGGVVLSVPELERKRLRNGECVSCGQKLFKKKFFKLTPLTTHGLVIEGRCLRCNPQDPTREGVVLDAVVASAPRKLASAVSAVRIAQGGRSGGQRRPPPKHSASMTAPSTSNGAATGRGHRSVQSTGNAVSNPRPFSQSITAPPSNNARHGRDAMAQSATAARTFRRNSFRAIQDSDAQQLQRAQMHKFDETIAESSDEDDLGGFGHRNEPPAAPAYPRNPSVSSSSRCSTRRDDFLLKSAIRPEELDHSMLNESERENLAKINDPHASYMDVINSMLMSSVSFAVQLEGILALSKFHSPSDETMAVVRSSCGFEVIVSAMGSCHNNSFAQTGACKVLFVASVDNYENQLAIADAGGIDAIADAMIEFADDDVVLEGALLALSNVCVPRENVRNILDANLIELTVGAMNGSVENCGVQEHGAAVMANLAAHDEARDRITESGGCNAIVVSMVVNPNDVAVQIQALHAISNLCVSDDDKKINLADAGGIDAVIGAMQYHRDDPHIQEYGSWALSVLGMNEDNKSYIGREGGADVIVRSMWVHPDNPEVQERGCRALWTLSVDPANKKTMVDTGAISAVVSAMSNHADDCSIQEKGCGVLANLAANDDNLKVRIVEEEALDVVVMGMVLHGENELLQHRACSLLRKLCIPQNVEPMIVSNISALLVVMVDNFPDLSEKAQFVLDQLE